MVIEIIDLTYNDQANRCYMKREHMLVAGSVSPAGSHVSDP